MMAHFLLDDLQQLEQRFRVQFLNTVSGFKNAMLIGTRDVDGAENLGVFNSIVHIGANPPLLGFVMRPLTVPRQTYSNLKSNNHYTFNLIGLDFLEKAHQAAAKYPAGISEFEKVGLTPYYSDTLVAPYVLESAVKIGLSFVEEHLIKANETRLIVGAVEEIILPSSMIREDGSVELESASILSTSGLDTYYLPAKVRQMAYPRP